VKQSTQALLSMDATAAVRACTLNQRILKTLVVSLAVVMRDEFGHSSSKWRSPMSAVIKRILRSTAA